MPERFLGFPNLVPLKRSVAVCEKEQHDSTCGSDFRWHSESDSAIHQQRRRASHRDREPDVGKKGAMIVHYFGQRQQRSRQKRDQKPEQTETDHARFLKHGSRNRARREQNREREARPKARIISGGKGIEVVIGREPARPEKRFEVEKSNVSVRDQ